MLRTPENSSRPVVLMLANSRELARYYRTKLAEHDRQLNYMLIKEVSRGKHVRPSFIEPMQVLPARELPDNGAWSYEAKLDGYRCLVANRGGSVVLWSRRGTGFTERFPSIARTCEKLPIDTLIDAEVVS